MLNIVWFKRDLRTHDHRALVAASLRGRVLPIYIVEPEYWAQADASARHWEFVSECLDELRADLAQLGQPLILKVGEAVDVLSDLAETFERIRLWSHEETGNDWTFQRDKRVADWARTNGIEWTEFQDEGVIRRLKTRNGWARKWNAHMAQQAAIAPSQLEPVWTSEIGKLPTQNDLGLCDDLCYERQRGGRDAALQTLHSFLHERGQPYRRAMSSPLRGAIHCSRISPYLAWGALSMREVAQSTSARQREIKATGEKGGWRDSLSSFSARLHWRNHFMQKLEDEPRIEHQNLHPAYDPLRSSQPDPHRLRAWQLGETGLPFVDACMRCLRATGWMNFRMRAMLMSVSSYHLWLDWKKPGEHLARLFTDYEPGIHWPQVQMQSGTTGINTVRIYNPVKQGYDQDPGGDFVRKWVPELQLIPTEYIHEPWCWPEASTLLGKAYPFPIVDHLEAAKQARQKVWAVRGGSAYRSAATAIQNKHGSRKSGIKHRGQRKPRKTAEQQLSLPLEKPSS